MYIYYIYILYIYSIYIYIYTSSLSLKYLPLSRYNFKYNFDLYIERGKYMYI
jgi:hypothetical protein